MNLGLLALATLGAGELSDLQQEWEEWWAAGHTQMSVWDHSWLTPRLVCGFRFMRIPPKSGLDGGLFLPLPVLGLGEDQLLSNIDVNGSDSEKGWKDQIPPEAPLLRENTSTFLIGMILAVCVEMGSRKTIENS